MRLNISNESILLFFYKNVADLPKSAIDLLVDPDTGALNQITEYNRMRQYHNANLAAIEEATKKGVPTSEILRRLQKAAKSGTKARTIGEIISGKLLFEGNLLQEGVTYRHPLLRIVEPPVIRDGQLVSGGTVTRAEVFTIDDLAKYYVDKLHPTIPRSQIVMTLKRLLQYIHLDDILHGIDIAAASGSKKDPDDVYSIKPFCDIARAEREQLDAYERGAC